MLLLTLIVMTPLIALATSLGFVNVYVAAFAGAIVSSILGLHLADAFTLTVCSWLACWIVQSFQELIEGYTLDPQLVLLENSEGSTIGLRLLGLRFLLFVVGILLPLGKPWALSGWLVTPVYVLLMIAGRNSTGVGTRVSPIVLVMVVQTVGIMCLNSVYSTYAAGNNIPIAYGLLSGMIIPNLICGSSVPSTASPAADEDIDLWKCISGSMLTYMTPGLGLGAAAAVVSPAPEGRMQLGATISGFIEGWCLRTYLFGAGGGSERTAIGTVLGSYLQLGDAPIATNNLFGTLFFAAITLILTLAAYAMSKNLGLVATSRPLIGVIQLVTLIVILGIWAVPFLAFGGALWILYAALEVEEDFKSLGVLALMT